MNNIYIYIYIYIYYSLFFPLIFYKGVCLLLALGIFTIVLLFCL
jgi:hypothetical protein